MCVGFFIMKTKPNTNLNGYAISEELFLWLKKNLPPAKTILELGSGTGTKELTKHWKVYSVEQDEKWLGVAENSNYIYAPLKQYGLSEWFDIDVLQKELPQHYDLIIVDAPTGISRLGFIGFLRLFNTNVPIIIDDTHREEERRMATKLGGILKKCVFDYSGFEKSFSVIQ